MTAGTGHGFFSVRSAVAVLGLAVFAAIAPASSFAQDAERPGLLNRLFNSKPAYRIEDPPAEIVRPKAQPKKKPRAARVQGGGDEPPPQVAVVTKQADARVVLVIGDFLASGLAEGLTTAMIDNPNVRVVDRSSGSSGFVRADFHNWPEKVGELITAERPAAIVVMIGANDRQQMLVDGVREAVRSENWSREYAERADELAKAITARKVPLLWVGMPAFKSPKMMLDTLALNEMYRAAATAAGGEYVDIWDGFVDENGAYISNGPDLNGQPSRLRANDGINLARPGKRKVAFYVEKPLYKALGEDPAAAAAQVSALAARPAYRLFGPFGPSEPQDAADLDVVVDANELGPIDPARPVALRTPALDGGSELLGADAAPRTEARTPAEKLAIEGIAPPAPLGRADQFSWPQLASAATVMMNPNLNTTRNKIATPSQPQEPAVDRASLRAVRNDVLTEPQPPMPGRSSPEIRPDRLEEISPERAAPDVAATEPPMTTPATAGKATTPEFARGDQRDLAPFRGAPRESYKRPKSIGPEPTRAPTAVPRPVKDVFSPAEAAPGIPSASAEDNAPEATVDPAPARPDSAPARAAVPNVPSDIVDDTAPPRAAPRKAAPMPVAALPGAKTAPLELVATPDAPKPAGAPNVAIEPATGMAAAKAVGIEATGSSSSPSASTSPAPAGAPARAAPSILPDAATGGAAMPAQADMPGAPANNNVPPAAPATPVAPAPPSVLPGKAATRPYPEPGERASLAGAPTGAAGPAGPAPDRSANREDVTLVRPVPAVGEPAVANP